MFFQIFTAYVSREDYDLTLLHSIVINLVLFFVYFSDKFHFIALFMAIFLRGGLTFTPRFSANIALFAI